MYTSFELFKKIKWNLKGMENFNKRIFFVLLLNLLLILCYVFLLTYFKTVNFNIILFSYSFFLLGILITVLVLIKNIFSPVFFFSILFLGYPFCGIYFSFYTNINNAIYFTMLNLPYPNFEFNSAMLSVIFGYIFFIFGYYSINKIKFKVINFDLQRINIESNHIKNFSVLIFIIGFLYWIFISFKIANGPLDLLSKMGIFASILNKNISTTPYLFSYIGSSLLFLSVLKINKKIPLYVILIIFVSFLMQLSRARLAGSILFLVSFFLMFILYQKKKISLLKITAYLGIFIIVLGLLYMYRFYSNMSYINKEISSNYFELLGNLFFGRTNVGDMQSIAITYHYISEKGILMGRTFFDFLRFWIDKLIPSNVDILSVGIRLKKEYFPLISGAPAPGIISEMIMNFGIIGITLGMYILGMFLNFIGKLIQPDISKLNLYIYVKFLLFVFILQKVDSTSIQRLIWDIIPVFIILLFFYVFQILIIKGNRNENNSFDISSFKI